MPKSSGAKKAMKNFQDQYGKKRGKQIYYATANKQDRDTDTFKKESLKLVDDMIIECDGAMMTIPAGTVLSEAGGIVGIYDPKTMTLVSTNESGKLGIRIAKNRIADQPLDVQKRLQIWIDGRPIKETVGSGAIAMIPNALGEKPKKKKKKKEVDEASNSQVSELNLDH